MGKNCVQVDARFLASVNVPAGAYRAEFQGQAVSDLISDSLGPED